MCVWEIVKGLNLRAVEGNVERRGHKTSVIRLGRAIKADSLGFDLRALGSYGRV